jgi:cysteine synthase A
MDPEAAFVVPERFSVWKRNLMAAQGAEIVNTSAGEGMGDAIDRAREMADSRANAVVPRQFVIPPSAEAHYEDDR